MAGANASADLRAKHASAGVAMSAATMAMAATAGIQAVLYLSSFGVDGRTDGFFVAFGAYAIFGVFSQSIRVSSVNLLVGDRPRLSLREFAAALVLIAVPVAVATIPLASLTAHVLAPGLDASDRAVTADALPILGGAMILQLWAAGAATLLAVRDRFGTVAGAYILGAVAGLVTYVAVVGAADELALGWSMLGMAVVTCGLMLAGLRDGWNGEGAPDAPLRLRALLAKSGLILGRTGIYLVFNALYLVTVAFTGAFGAPGDTTVLSYAYLFASYLVAGTAFALGMSRIADMRRGALADWRDLVPDTVPPGFRYSMLLVAPAMAALITAGAPLMGELFPDSFGSGDVETLRGFAALMAPWTVAALLVNLLLPALFALGKGRFLAILALPLLALQVAASVLGGALFGGEGVVGAYCIAPGCFAVVLLVNGSRTGRLALARELARDGLRFAVLAAACFAAASLAAMPAHGLAEPVLAAGIGSVLYLVVAVRLAPRQIKLLIGAIRPASA